MKTSVFPTHENNSAKPLQNEKQHPSETLEIGGREGPDPVRYGDWEINGKCVDF